MRFIILKAKQQHNDLSRGNLGSYYYAENYLIKKDETVV